MLRGLLTRTFEVAVGGMRLSVKAQRFCSMADVETAYLRYAVDVLDGSGTLDMELALDGDVTNEDANWDERFWDIDSAGGDGEGGHLTATTRKTGFTVSHAMRTSAWLDSAIGNGSGSWIKKEDTAVRYSFEVEAGSRCVTDKTISLLRGMDHPEESIQDRAEQKVEGCWHWDGAQRYKTT